MTISPDPRPAPVGRRIVFAFLITAFTLLLLWLGRMVLAPGGWTVWEILIFLCLALNAPWLGLSAATAAIGAAIRLFSPDPSAAVLPALRDLRCDGPLVSRTLLAVCVRNEDMSDVLPPLDNLLQGLTEAGYSESFAVGVLSDTSDPALADREAQAVAAMAASRPAGAVLYRRRTSNDGFKAGNVMDFLDNHAPGFDLMLLLDADSEMSAATVLRLVRIAEVDPRIAILQPSVSGRPASASFGHLFGFGHRHGSRIWSTGQAWWQDEEGPFWGHNALIRITPFRNHCRLGLLPDGSHILSHDHVEAARLHSAGWAVRVLPEDVGSREAHPPHMHAYLRRDLRWAAGNLQYRWLLRSPELSTLGRLQMFQAIAYYALTPLWFAMLPLAAINAVTGGGAETPRGLLLTLLLFAWLAIHSSKLAGYAEALVRPSSGAPTGPMLHEVLFTALFEPITAFDKMLTVLKLLGGRRSGWPVQERLERAVPWSMAFKAFWPHTLIGLLLLGMFAATNTFVLLVSLPFTLGLALCVPFCVLTSQPRNQSARTEGATQSIGQEARAAAR